MPDNFKYNLNISQRGYSSPYTVDLLGDNSPKKRKKNTRKKKKTAYKAGFIRFLNAKKELAQKLFIVAVILLALRFVFQILKFIYKVFYAFGWLIVFIARLFYFSFKAVFTLANKAFKFIEPLLLFHIKYVNKKFENNKSNREEDEQVREIPYEYARGEIGWSLSNIINFRGLKEYFSFKGTADSIKAVSRRAVPKPSRSYIKPALYLAAFMFIAILPFKGVGIYKELNLIKGKVLGVSEAAVNEMILATDAANNLDFETAGQNFERAGNDFLSAQNEIKEISSILSVLSIIPSKNIRAASDASDILEAGKLSAELGMYLSTALDSLTADDKSLEKVVNSFYVQSQKMSDIGGRLQIILDRIDINNFPEEYQSKLEMLMSKSDMMIKSLDEMVDIIEKIRIFLGFDYDKRYLLVFQNNAELRASGGFVGSYALIDFSNGNIKNIEVPEGGSYDTEGGLIEKIVSPRPLWLLKPRWYFWDANWWPDWPTSAEKLQWFYEKSGGPSVDGVISITPDLVEDILNIIGSLDMSEEYGLEFSSENFRDITQIFSELKPKEHNAISGLNEKIAISSAASENIPEEKLEEYKEQWAENNKPKKIIGDILNQLILELPEKIDKEVFFSLLEAVAKNIREKHILFFFHDEVLRDKTAELGWDGRMKESLQDYLMVVHSNIGGGKSDLKMKESITHSANIDEEGTVTVTLKISRTHTADKDELFTGENNVDWLRVYVPEGSKLIGATGFNPPREDAFKYPEPEWKKDPQVMPAEEGIIDAGSGTHIYDELGKTVFANWVQTKPGSVSEAVFRYELPFKVKSEEKNESGITEFFKQLFNPGQKELLSYSLLVQKQPGARNVSLSSYLRLEGGKKINWAYPPELTVNESSWRSDLDLSSDIFFAAVLEE